MGSGLSAAAAPSESRSNLAHKLRPVSRATDDGSSQQFDRLDTSVSVAAVVCLAPSSHYINVNAETCSTVVHHVSSIRDIRFFNS